MTTTAIPDPDGLCACGCQAEVPDGAYFKTGHDKKAESDLNALLHEDSVLVRLVSHGYGPGGDNLHEAAIASGRRERCGINGCNVSGKPGSEGMRKHRASHRSAG